MYKKPPSKHSFRLQSYFLFSWAEALALRTGAAQKCHLLWSRRSLPVATYVAVGTQRTTLFLAPSPAPVLPSLGSFEGVFFICFHDKQGVALATGSWVVALQYG